MSRPDGKVNPALIRGTGKTQNSGSYIYAIDDPQSEAVDLVYRKLPFELQQVIDFEYGSPLTQKEKARMMGIGRTTYWIRLNSAHDAIEQAILGVPKSSAA